MSTPAPDGALHAGPAKIIFLHIVKTAGTSVVDYFRQVFGPAAVLAHGDFMRYPQGQPLPLPVFEQYRLLSGHFGYTQVAPYLDRAYSFVFLRDPVERVLSFYKFCLHPDMQRNFAVARAAQALGLEGFLESDLPEVVEMLDNQQTWQLARMYWQADRQALAACPGHELLEMARAHLGRFSRIGLTESFSADFAAILADLGLPVPPVVPRKFETREPLRTSHLAPSTLERLRERMALDYQLYDFVSRRRAVLAGQPAS